MRKIAIFFFVFSKLIGFGQTDINKDAFKKTGYQYLIERVKDTYYAHSFRASLPNFSGNNFATVLQRAIRTIAPEGQSATGGGQIQLTEGDYDLYNEVVIEGWESSGQNYSSIQISGVGFSTKLRVKGAGKSGLIVRNRVNLILRDFYMSVGSSSVSAIRLQNDGCSSERSVNKGEINGVWINSGGTGPAFYATNFFNLNVPWLRVDCTTNTAVHLEQTSKTMHYGNSTFGYLQANGANKFPYSGLSISSDIPGKYLNLMSFQGLYIGSGHYGLYTKGAQNNTFTMVAIEYITYPVYLDGDVALETAGNNILSGQLYPKVMGTAIHASSKTSGNFIKCYIIADDKTVRHVNDLANSSAGNEYDLLLSPSGDQRNFNITEKTRFRLKSRRDGTITQNF